MLCVCGPVSAQTGALTVEIGSAGTSGEAMAKADAAARSFARSAARLTESSRKLLARAGRYDPGIPFSLPTTVRLTKNGRTLPGPASNRDGALTLAFDSSGPRAFPPSYRQLLEDTFSRAKSHMDAVFGAPASGGTVFVRNFDADIGDRHAVTGGYYVHDNGASEREIRFPVYNASEAAAVNFVHCLLLAYLGPNSYAFDAFQEGLVRAATMRVVRFAGALPAGLDPDIVNQVLENTYDVGTWYDWYNQRALGGPAFIAPNLLNVPLPPGGSLGGIYLLRYTMAGSAWQKLLAEYTGFIKTFNEQFYTNPTIGGDVPALVVLGQNVLDTLAGAPNATVEGKSFADWYLRQFILQTSATRGLKLLVQPLPLPPDPGTSDFGVFAVQATYFETVSGGNEILLSGVSYPIFWSDAYNRIFPSAQEDRMDIAGAYGAVAPNLPNLHLDLPYRCAVDIPVQDRIARAYLPAGGIATGQNPTENDFYGTVVGVAGGPGVTVRVRLTIGGGTVIDNIPATFNAFGFRINTPEFLGYQRLRVEVIRRQNNLDTVVIDRRVNKGPGPIGLDLRTNDGEATFNILSGVPRGLSTLGLPIDPFTTLAGEMLGIPESEVLLARYNGSRARYDIYPDCGPPVVGNGYFLRLENAQAPFSIAGRTSPGAPIAVALRPGWNLIACPLTTNTPTSRVTVVHAADFPKAYADAVGTEVGATFFEFAPGPPDQASGAPETGTMVEATEFKAGKAYFVRVLVAEGVSLLFSPETPSQLAPSSGTGMPGGKWALRLSLRNGPHHADAVVGQSSVATIWFDPREDSTLPPGMGGMQLVCEASEQLYRDFRPLRSPQTYRIRATNLRPGRTYSVRLTFDEGSLRRYVFRDRDAFVSRVFNGPAEYSFTARGPERFFEIRVERGSW